ncbi:ubiquinone/menaquinone biosynthesis protein [Bdellovibrio bacteriovorus]|uniref:Ubiquinone/menaquinone biosynthesis protein n=1 Tax=Bdellovibrio bacteriovorus TaxID=959 RepID=A0A150WHK6_BDEBC|nr:class I SAM-dependent methyltransferase [Bdellovibrio bacteriovorus]KYG63143.1 ubiquinone/menaquinone biosynthesis protein [Bdellovibrio bacteriovorus]
MKLKIPYKDKITLGYSLMRSAHFAAQQFSLPFFEFLATGKTGPRKSLEAQHIKRLYSELFQLLKKDSENIARGLYPLDVLKPEKAVRHFMRYPRLLVDGYQISKRREQRNQNDFDPEAQEFLKELPEYYQRNFHFQTGGYLTKDSAELYEHQVEILFSGSADAMRRLIIPLAKEAYPGDGEGLHFLEVAAGTGRLTRFMKLAYPKAKITVLDLSYPYLKKAQDNLKEFERVDFVQGAAESLPFQEGKFDFIYSCFLFHELPLEIRRQVVEESFRVLKAGGHMGFVDSVQKEDAKDLDWALEQFPVDFHEPFYKNYTQNPMEGLMHYRGFSHIKKDQGFFAKAVLGQKPLDH